MPAITKEIIFNNSYPKLKKEKFARLIAVFNYMTGALLRQKFPDLCLYDTERDDGRFYLIDKNETYMLLLFLGINGNMFSSIRKQNPDNEAKYNDSIGDIFAIKIEKSDKGGV